MRRIALGCVLLALVAVGVRVVDAQAAAANRPADPKAAAEPVDRTPPTLVALYGDSLAHQSRAAFANQMHLRAPGDLIVSTFPGTAPCDYRTEIVTDLVTRRPQVAVLEFSGNSFTDCMRNARGALLRVGSDAWRKRYLDDLRVVVDVAWATDTTVVWATAPPVDHPGSPEDYPRVLTAAVRKVAADEPHLEVADTGAALSTGDRSYRTTLPCRADEQEFCTDGRIVVRSVDRLHFDCHAAAVVWTTCPGYSAGARRYGDALADAAIAAG